MDHGDNFGAHLRVASTTAAAAAVTGQQPTEHQPPQKVIEQQPIQQPAKQSVLLAFLLAVEAYIASRHVGS